MIKIGEPFDPAKFRYWKAIGQAFRGSLPRFMEPNLFYWAREERGAEAEIDYLLQCGTGIVPIEV